MKPQRPLLLFIRKLLPLTRRAFSLLIKGRTKPSFELFHAKSPSGKLIDTTVNLKVLNGLILQVNGHSLPIFSDNKTITLKVPRSSPQLEIKVRGLFGSVERVINVEKSSVQLNSPSLKLNQDNSNPRILDSNPTIQERSVQLQNQALTLKDKRLNIHSSFSLRQENESVRIKQLEPNTINNLSIKDVSEELEANLTTNQIQYEE